MGVLADCGGDGETGTAVVAVAARDQLAHDSSITNSEIMVRLNSDNSDSKILDVSCLPFLV